MEYRERPPSRTPVIDTGRGTSPTVVVADDGSSPTVVILLTTSPRIGQRFAFGGRMWQLVTDRGEHRGFIARPASERSGREPRGDA